MEPQDLTVIFIGGHEHSGSTILDLYLQRHPKVVSVGEAGKLERYTRGAQRDRTTSHCRCGSVFRECPFWSRVAEEAARLGRPLDTMGFGADDADYGASSEVFFQAVAEAAQCTTIVDSSKGIRRLLRLQTETRLRIVPVHVSRDLYGFLASHKKRKNIGRLDAVSLSWRYISSNVRFSNALRRVPHVSSRLEDLAANPSSVLQAIYELAGVAPLAVTSSDASRDEPIHNLAGNRLLRGQPERLSPDRAAPTVPLFRPPFDTFFRLVSRAIDVYPRDVTHVTTMSDAGKSIVSVPIK